jgi:hypothetical protein
MDNAAAGDAGSPTGDWPAGSEASPRELAMLKRFNKEHRLHAQKEMLPYIEGKGRAYAKKRVPIKLRGLRTDLWETRVKSSWAITSPASARNPSISGFLNKPKTKRTLHITIHECKSLPNAKMVGKQHIYAKAYLIPGVLDGSKRTGVVMNGGAAPHFTEKHSNHLTFCLIGEVVGELVVLIELWSTHIPKFRAGQERKSRQEDKLLGRATTGVPSDCGTTKVNFLRMDSGGELSCSLFVEDRAKEQQQKDGALLAKKLNGGVTPPPPPPPPPPTPPPFPLSSTPPLAIESPPCNRCTIRKRCTAHEVVGVRLFSESKEPPGANADGMVGMGSDAAAVSYKGVAADKKVLHRECLVAEAKEMRQAFCCPKMSRTAKEVGPTGGETKVEEKMEEVTPMKVRGQGAMLKAEAKEPLRTKKSMVRCTCCEHVGGGKWRQTKPENQRQEVRSARIGANHRCSLRKGPLVGRSFNVYWPGDGHWYRATVSAYDHKSMKHTLSYEGGSKELIYFDKQPEWRLQEAGNGSTDTGQCLTSLCAESKEGAWDDSVGIGSTESSRENSRENSPDDAKKYFGNIALKITRGAELSQENDEMSDFDSETSMTPESSPGELEDAAEIRVEKYERHRTAVTTPPRAVNRPQHENVEFEAESKSRRKKCAGLVCCSFGLCYAYSCFGGGSRDAAASPVTPPKGVPCTPIPGVQLADALDKLADTPPLSPPLSPPFSPMLPCTEKVLLQSPIKPLCDPVHMIQVSV